MPASKHRERDTRSQSRAVGAILIAVQSPETSDLDQQRSLAELEHLVRGLGYSVHASFVQKRPTRSAPTYVGEGKLRELAALTGGLGEVPRGPAVARAHRDDLVVVADDELGPGQLRNLEAALGVEILDRPAVILRVFEARAQTREAKLEVELARLAYELPRIRDDHSLGDREGGGGRASRGHSNVELAKQRARERIATLRGELARVVDSAERRRRARGERFRVALVGYTNAGKSSLMRSLTGSDVLVEDKLFATLGTTVRPIVPALAPPVLVIDTVGFLDRLPHALVASFRSTLAEARDAQLLLHVVDAADPAFRRQAQVTEQVLADIGAAATPTWLVLNKVDRLAPDARAALALELPHAIQLSARDPRDGSVLRDRIAAFFADQLVEATLSIPYARQGAFAALRDRIHVVHEHYADAIEVTVRAPPDVLHELRGLGR